ncbi:MAG: cytochrome c3 family protein [Verrucomicrobia bacterium]|nr:cytochrome c3 family protein [Verrucomicrobiota bacterium]
MSTEGRQPAPDFDDRHYERPQKNWICGHAAEGCPCKLGPGPGGTCRAGPECTPQLVINPGETKGLWKCTRPADQGGSCPLGPNVDGTCCRNTPSCQPVRSLRARRGLLVRATLIACTGVLLLALATPRRAGILSPGPLTPVHTGAHFASSHGHAEVKDPAGCAECHPAAHSGPESWVGLALTTANRSGPLAPARLLGPARRDFTAMDTACQSCHQPHSFHQASVAQAASCSVCHLEHQGRDHNLLNVNPAHCTTCHGDAAQMQASATLAEKLPAALFAKILPKGQSAFPVARPAGGLTSRISSFAGDHPEFRLHQAGTGDRNPLAFNHALHLKGQAIPLLNNAPLDCQSCHVPDASGVRMQPVTYAQNCQSCHALQIDPATPSLTLPHGSAETARAVLRSLPVAYTDDAVRRLQLSGSALRTHVAEKLAAFQKLNPSGEALERRVFFGLPSAPVGRDSCNLCHTVESSASGGAPRIAPVTVPDIWLPRARFDHAKHTQTSCYACHASATTSTLTSDVLMPTKANCASCHGPAGGVTDSCTACHGFHNPPPPASPPLRAYFDSKLPTRPASLAAQP